jgi:hypothetical protein
MAYQLIVSVLYNAPGLAELGWGSIMVEAIHTDLLNFNCNCNLAISFPSLNFNLIAVKLVYTYTYSCICYPYKE